VPAPINFAVVAALAQEPVDWRFKGLPVSWSGRTPAEICGGRPSLFDDGATGPVCVLRAQALAHNIATMAEWCVRAGVELAPHAKTHMAPALLARQLAAGACAVTAATVAQVRVLRAFGVGDVILANEVVEPAGLSWLATELAADTDFNLVCWVDSVRGVELMAAALAHCSRPVDVCVEVGMFGGRTGCRSATLVDDVAAAAARCPQLRLVGVAGYEAARGHDITGDAVGDVTEFLMQMREAVLRLAGLFESDAIIVTAGGSTYFDVVADVLTGWPGDLSVRAILRSGCYVTHDHGLYARTSPLRFAGGLLPALGVWAQVVSRPEPDLAIVAMGRRDVSFDQELPVPQGLSGSVVTNINDQHAYLRLSRSDGRHVDVGTWLEFGVSHPCTTLDKWRLIPMLDGDNRVVELIQTYF
jgi:D-serine deaminase-like pyridoxal phosphate-dependent protein